LYFPISIILFYFLSCKGTKIENSILRNVPQKKYPQNDLFYGFKEHKFHFPDHESSRYTQYLLHLQKSKYKRILASIGARLGLFVFQIYDSQKIMNAQSSNKS
jgi:hypothetical protein